MIAKLNLGQSEALIRDFFGTYFHEDWPDEADDPLEIVRSYAAAAGDADSTRSLAHSIRQLASCSLDETAIEQALFRELGCYYVPSLDGKGVRRWLTEVATELERQADGAPNGLERR